MSKMTVRRRKARKMRKTESKYLKLLENIKPRVPQTPVGEAFRSIKEYNRKDNKRAIDEGLDG